MKQLALWVVLFLILLLSFQHWYYGKARQEDILYSQFIRQVDAGNIAKATFVDRDAPHSRRGRAAAAHRRPSSSTCPTS